MVMNVLENYDVIRLSIRLFRQIRGKSLMLVLWYGLNYQAVIFMEDRGNQSPTVVSQASSSLTSLSVGKSIRIFISRVDVKPSLNLLWSHIILPE